MQYYVALKVLRNQHRELVCFLNLEGFSCSTRRIDECMIILTLSSWCQLLYWIFPLNWKLPRGVAHSPLKSMQITSGRGSFQTVPSMLLVLQQGLSSGTCRLAHLTWKVCWPCTGGVMSLSCGGKRSPFVPKVRYRTALSGELLCVALGIHEGKWSHGAFPLKRHRLNLLNL